MFVTKKERSLILKVFFVYMVILIFFSMVGDQGLIQSYWLWKERTQLERSIETIQTQVVDLRRSVLRFRDSDKTIEQYAREKLNLKGDHEIEYIFPQH